MFVSVHIVLYPFSVLSSIVFFPVKKHSLIFMIETLYAYTVRV